MVRPSPYDYGSAGDYEYALERYEAWRERHVLWSDEYVPSNDDEEDPDNENDP